jgi:hypothetical protein
VTGSWDDRSADVVGDGAHLLLYQGAGAVFASDSQDRHAEFGLLAPGVLGDDFVDCSVELEAAA